MEYLSEGGHLRWNNSAFPFVFVINKMYAAESVPECGLFCFWGGPGNVKARTKAQQPGSPKKSLKREGKFLNKKNPEDSCVLLPNRNHHYHSTSQVQFKPMVNPIAVQREKPKLLRCTSMGQQLTMPPPQPLQSSPSVHFGKRPPTISISYSSVWSKPLSPRLESQPTINLQNLTNSEESEKKPGLRRAISFSTFSDDDDDISVVYSTHGDRGPISKLF